MEREIGRRDALKLAPAVVAGATVLPGARAWASQTATDPIPIGSILPHTGALAPFGPGMEDAVTLAVSHVNAAGGPLGREIQLFARDSGSDARTAQGEYDRLVEEQGIVGFVGAAASNVSGPLARRVAADGVVQVSPSSTAPGLAARGYGADGVKYFARTAHNDVQQGIAAGVVLNEFVEADTAAFLFSGDVGDELAAAAGDEFHGETLQVVPYTATSDPTATLDRLFRGDPDAVGFVGFPDSGRSLLQAWADGDYGGQWVLPEALNSSDLFRAIPDVVEGMYVVSPNPEPTPGTNRFRGEFGDDPTPFAAHAYDALFLVALAIHRAGVATGTAVAENLGAVSRKPGITVTVDEFRTATELIDRGTAVNYQGASGPVDLNEELEPGVRFVVSRVRDGQPNPVDVIPRPRLDDVTASTTRPPSTSSPEPTTATPEPVTPTGTVFGSRTPDRVQLAASGAVGLAIGFLVGNSEGSETKKTAVGLLAVLFGGGGVLRMIQAGPGPASLVVAGVGAFLLGTLLGIYLREHGVALTSSADPDEPSD